MDASYDGGIGCTRQPARMSMAAGEVPRGAIGPLHTRSHQPAISLALLAITYRLVWMPVHWLSSCSSAYFGMVYHLFFVLVSAVRTLYDHILWCVSKIPVLGWIIKPNQKSVTVAQLLSQLDNAKTQAEYSDLCYRLDEELGLDQWRKDPIGPYAYDKISDRFNRLKDAVDRSDYVFMMSLIRSHARDIGHIISPRLYRQAFSGTKHLIEDYVCFIARTIDNIAVILRGRANSGRGRVCVMPIQNLFDFIFNLRQSMGRTALFLQGGATFGLIHLGVVRSLQATGLLPRIIVGESTGSLVAALVCTQREPELAAMLSDNTINLNAFKASAESARPSALEFILLRPWRFWEVSWHILDFNDVLDASAIEECAKDNLGDITFQEAYSRTKRILNIVIYRDGKEPLALNYINAPRVLVRSAAVVSCTNRSISSILSKSLQGNITYWTSTLPACIDEGDSSHQPLRNEILHRVRSQFNVSHLIISHARPSLVACLRHEVRRPSQYQFSSLLLSACSTVTHYLSGELAHHIRLANVAGLVPRRLARYIVTEKVTGSHCDIIPNVNLSDMLHMLDYPTPETIEKWALIGDKATWPVLEELKIRCLVEIELDRSYHMLQSIAGDKLGWDNMGEWTGAQLLEGTTAKCGVLPKSSAARKRRRTHEPCESSSKTGDS